jgi:hypothetical protein
MRWRRLPLIAAIVGLLMGFSESALGLSWLVGALVTAAILVGVGLVLWRRRR